MRFDSSVVALATLKTVVGFTTPPMTRSMPKPTALKMSNEEEVMNKYSRYVNSS